MDFPKPSKSAGGFVDSIKDKLSFGSHKAQDEAYYEEEFDVEEYGPEGEFDDYGEYGYDESYASSGYGDGIGGYSDPYGGSSAREPYRPPRLVSMGDIQNTTSAYGVMTPGGIEDRASASSVPGYLSSSADPRFASRASSAPRPARSSSRITVSADEEEIDYTEGFDLGEADRGLRDFVSPYQRQNAEKTAAMPSTGSSGLDGLFAPTDASAASSAPAERNTTTIGGHYSRKVEVFEPKNFEEAVDIVTMLKEGSVVVLNLKYVNANLSKRVLDFAFGVVAALDAQITYEAPQVFTITRSGKLTLVERDQLRSKRVL